MKAKAMILVAAVVLGGCLPIWTAREMEAEIQSLQAQQRELEWELEQREQSLTEMIEIARSDIEELEQVLVEARDFLSRNSADLGADVHAQEEALSHLRGELEEVAFRFRRFEEAFNYFREDVDLRFAEEWPTDPADLLELAQALMEDEDYRQARRALERYLSRHEDHRQVNTARITLGELYFVQEQWVNAISQFRQLLHPDARAVDSHQSLASLRIAQSFIELGNCRDAAIFLETVIEDFPRSREVSQAQQLQRNLAGRCP
jgi:TolA-binding protein